MTSPSNNRIQGIFIQEALQHTKLPFQIEGEDPREDYKQVHFLS